MKRTRLPYEVLANKRLLQKLQREYNNGLEILAVVVGTMKITHGHEAILEAWEDVMTYRMRQQDWVVEFLAHVRREAKRHERESREWAKRVQK